MSTTMAWGMDTTSGTSRSKNGWVRELGRRFSKYTIISAGKVRHEGMQEDRRYIMYWGVEALEDGTRKLRPKQKLATLALSRGKIAEGVGHTIRCSSA